MVVLNRLYYRTHHGCQFLILLDGNSARKKLKFADSDLSFIDEDLRQPIYELLPLKYTAGRIIKILLQAKETKICRVKPTAVTESSTYVIDTRSLRNPEDIKKDDFGI
jgi:hypothetical protein